MRLAQLLFGDAMKIELKSICNVKGCEGGPGDVVDAPDELAQRLIDGRGAVAAGNNAKVTPPAEPEVVPEPPKATAKKKA